jgi:hypothetical protein
MEHHVKLVAILNIVYRSLTLIGAIFLAALAIWFTDIYEFLVESYTINPHEIPLGLLNIVPIILSLIAVWMVIVSLAGIIGGIGVLNRKEWGRIVLLVVSFFNLIRVPLGTVLGVYGIWVLLNKETIQLFTPFESRVN